MDVNYVVTPDDNNEVTRDVYVIEKTTEFSLLEIFVALKE